MFMLGLLVGLIVGVFVGIFVNNLAGIEPPDGMF